MKSFFFALAVWLFALPAFAQQPAPAKTKTVEERAEEITQRMVKELELSAEQTIQVRTISLDVAKELEAIEALRTTDREAFRARRKTVTEKANERYLPLLNAQQAERYKLLQNGGAKKK